MNKNNKPFKFADFFPIRKGDLVMITEECNQESKDNWYNPNGDDFMTPPNHELYGKTLLVLTDIIEDRVDDIIRCDFVQVFVQDTSEFENVNVVDLKRIFVP